MFVTVWFTIHTPAVQMAVGRGGGGGHELPPVLVEVGPVVVMVKVEIEVVVDVGPVVVEVEVVVTAKEINLSRTATTASKQVQGWRRCTWRQTT